MRRWRDLLLACWFWWLAIVVLWQFPPDHATAPLASIWSCLGGFYFAFWVHVVCEPRERS